MEISKDGEFIGFFSALVVRKFGLKIVGSPFAGWSTPYMGLDVVDSSKKTKILQELIPFVMKETSCIYLQICDRDFDKEELELIKNINASIRMVETLELGIEVVMQCNTKE